MTTLTVLTLVFFGIATLVAPAAGAALDRHRRRKAELARLTRIPTAPSWQRVPPQRVDPSPKPRRAA